MSIMHWFSCMLGRTNVVTVMMLVLVQCSRHSKFAAAIVAFLSVYTIGDDRSSAVTILLCLETH